MRHELGDLRRGSRHGVDDLVACCAATGSPARPAPHPQHAAGGQKILSSGSSMRFIVVPGSPGCLPGRRLPRSRSDRSAPLSYTGYGMTEAATTLTNPCAPDAQGLPPGPPGG